jgi:hypothetical protein
MRYGLGSVPDCLFSKFGDVGLMSNKLTPKLDKCFFVWYPRKTKGYYFYNKAEGKVFVAHNGVFMEKEFFSKRVSGSKVQLEEIQETPKNVSAPTDPIQEVHDVVSPDVEVPAPRRSIRARRATKKFTLLTTEQYDILLLDNDGPITYTEAMMGPDYEKWLGAMESEIESMHDNCHTPFRERGNEASIHVPRMFKSHI